MKILQNPISDNHLSAMFFDGVVAEDGDYSLVTYQDGELGYKDKLYIGAEIRELGETGAINDNDVDEEFTVDIYVDKFFAIKYNDTILEEYIYNDYDEAIEEFENFLNKI
jgi:hypothetical protein